MEIPVLGVVTKDAGFDFLYRSAPIVVPVLGGKHCQFVVERYDGDANKEDFHTAIANFLSIGPSVLDAVTADVFRYYQDCIEYCDPDDDAYVAIESPEDVWKHVQLGDQPWVKRRHRNDRGVYVALSCECDWEIEHGLEIVFKNGLRVNKIGAYNGHLTNADAYNDLRLENVIYRSSQ